MSLLAITSRSLSSSMIQPLSCWPALTPSTTTTPTPSPSSCTTKWIIAYSIRSEVLRLPGAGRAVLDAVLRVDRRDAAIGEQLRERRVDVFHQQVIRTAQPHGDRPAQFGLAVLGVHQRQRSAGMLQVVVADGGGGSRAGRDLAARHRLEHVVLEAEWHHRRGRAADH